MKTAKLVHNPDAGDESHSKKKLIKTIESEGFDCIYTSSKDKKFLKEIEKEVDFLVVAGGDGTVRTVVQKMLQRGLLEKKYPIAVLPMGTANNISQSLGLHADQETIIRSWARRNVRQLDVGKIEDFDAANFFVEGMGFGVFPRLIKDMNEVDSSLIDTPKKSLKVAREKLHEIVQTYEAKHCDIEADGRDYSGKYLMVELMNIASIGPNLVLAPMADPGDGFFELILITDKQKKEFISYIEDKQQGKEGILNVTLIKAKNVTFKWEGKLAHIDDNLIFMEKGQELKIEMLKGVLDFLVLPS
ncbi:diacylglycerol kinase family enzyme [Arcticibacter pallidicorallinus]|uniref:Diacylglycerol kinase family enzyme n=1 Tax=Arcticibacter pallidicorallinus TaxID=1259464 RepID=A0A2T0TXF3_9SPHI|nr:diacylglycerol kinase family protein [Arcticibacter pallidicorallinus]PRY50364.1 diacylglycerol kinase family enzyme [Arcticibacter pallidicorallinus]